MIEAQDQVPEELDERLSAIEAELQETTDQVAQNTRNLDALAEKTDRTIENFNEVNRDIIDRLDSIEERIDDRRQIINRRE